MTTVDLIITLVVLLSVLLGIARGFLRESVALLGWLGGLWLAWRYSDVLEPFLGGALTGTELQTWVARGLILLAVIVAAWLLGSLLNYLVQRSGLTLGMDRMLGSVFGLVRAAVIIGFAVMLGQAAQLDTEAWWQDSRLLPMGEEMAGVLSGYVETGKRLVEDSLSDS
jgi:membrane protein required for colicin V production